ncbi:hypothetical protein LJC20_02825, partial [Eubacteriales bacterium OttesenSCG-928-M02]|nr:hypothetical protein [Eubacteriales bacterium OttesenSCG-928-M02]
MHFLFSLLQGLIAVLVVLFLMTRGKKTMLRTCIVLFLVACILGFSLYTLGYLPPNATAVQVGQAVLRAIFSTGRMFLINDDYGFLLDDPHAQWLVSSMWFQIPFWLCHVLALIITAAAISALVGRRLMDFCRIRLRRYHTCYLLFGADERALALAENLAFCDGTRKSPHPKRLVILLVQEVTDDLRQDLAQMGCIALDYTDATLKSRLRYAGLGASSWRVGAYRIILMPQNDVAILPLSQGVLDAATAHHIPGDRLNLYLVSESHWLGGFHTTLFSRYPYPIHIQSEAELAARHMVSLLPPYTLLTFQGGIAQEDSFPVLVLGFGKTGQQALLSLIRNTPFLGTRLVADVVDASMPHLAHTFTQRYPGLPNTCSIQYHEMDVESPSFSQLLEEQGAKYRYVVLALNDDGVNLDTAQALSTWYARQQLPPPPMAVAVRQNVEFPAPQPHTIFFSQRHRIYSDAFLVRGDLDRMAVAVNGVYAAGLTDSTHVDGTPASSQALWDGLSDFHRESSRASADFIPAMLHLAGVTPQQLAQADRLPVSDAMALTLAETEHRRWNAFHYTMGYTAMDVEHMRTLAHRLQSQGADPSRCRQDDATKTHICLVPFEALSTVSQNYNALMEELG